MLTPEHTQKIISAKPWYTHAPIPSRHDTSQAQGEIRATLVIAQPFTRSSSGFIMTNSLIILAWPCTFSIQLPRGAQIYLSHYQGGANFILIAHTPRHVSWQARKLLLWLPSYRIAKLRNSIWQPQSMPLHILGINDDLRSKDPAGTPFEITTDGTS
jgi:hypothetical protein